MAWIRLSDDYNDHPKFDNLSDGAFRLWHQAMGYCRRYQTDGLIALATVRKLKAFTGKRMTELLTAPPEISNPLWLTIEGFGIKVHDYLEWNPSKDEENERRSDAKSRMHGVREQRKHHGTPAVRANNVRTAPHLCAEQFAKSARDVLGGEGRDRSSSEREFEGKPAGDLGSRAGRLREELYPAWYAKFRHGAKLRLMANALEFQDAMSVVETWDDARIEKLAQIVLTTDDQFIANTDRSFKIFAMKATWADDRLKQAEGAA